MGRGSPDDGRVAVRVLVVEDEPDIRDLLLIWLHDDPRCGGVHAAGDLPRALDAATTQPFDRVVLDYNVCGETSCTVLPTLRRLLPQARIVVFTAAPEAAEQAGVRALGADAVVAKGTTTFDHLLEAVLGD